jgi:hypothetical protein
VITELPGPTPAATVAQPAAAAAAAPTPVTTILGLAVGVLGNPVSGISAIIFACLACLLYARGRDVEAALRSMRPTRPVTRRQLKLWAKVIIAAAVLLGIAFIYATLTVFGTLLIVLAALAITAIWKGAGFQRALRAIPPGVKAWCIAAAARVRKSLVVRKLAAFWRWFLGTRVGRALGKASAKTVAGWRWLCASRLGRACGWLRRKFLSGCSTLKRWIMGAPEAIAAEMARTERIFELVREVPSEAKEGW